MLTRIITAHDGWAATTIARSRIALKIEENELTNFHRITYHINVCDVGLFFVDHVRRLFDFFPLSAFFFRLRINSRDSCSLLGKCATTTTPITMGICCTSDRFLMCIRLAMLLIFDARGKLHYARTEKIVKFSIWQRNKCSLIHRSTSFSTLLHN